MGLNFAVLALVFAKWGRLYETNDTSIMFAYFYKYFLSHDASVALAKGGGGYAWGLGFRVHAGVSVCKWGVFTKPMIRALCFLRQNQGNRAKLKKNSSKRNKTSYEKSDESVRNIWGKRTIPPSENLRRRTISSQY